MNLKTEKEKDKAIAKITGQKDFYETLELCLDITIDTEGISANRAIEMFE